MKLYRVLGTTITGVIAMAISIVGPFALQFASGASPHLTLNVSQTPSATTPLLTFYGAIKPAKSGATVSIQQNGPSGWKTLQFRTQVTKAGSWRLVVHVKNVSVKIYYRAFVVVGGERTYSASTPLLIKKLKQISQTSTELPAITLGQFGPGGRIHGADISRWQHPGEQQIDFSKMYDAGVRFVMIKASDTRDDADAQALKYLVMDHSAAQAAGLYTGFYHYASLPDTSDDGAITRDAMAQAQKVIWRLAAIGGYSERDLPYALDLEDKCIRLSSSGQCQKYATPHAVTLWATTFLGTLKEKTGKAPFVYSYASFLEGSMERNPQLSQYPLWLAHYAIDPFNPLNQPGQKTSGCYVNSWTTSNCDSQWTMWQYTSCGIAAKYGVPSLRLDLNIFRGDSSAFMGMVKRSWTPTVGEMMPKDEATTMVIEKLNSNLPSNVINFKVNVLRPDLSPVVTGTLKFLLDPSSSVTTAPLQSLVRSASGSWSLSLRGLPVGDFSGTISFIDASHTHAATLQSVLFTVEVAPTPAPTASPTPTATVKPTPKPSVDSCLNQIKN